MPWATMVRMVRWWRTCVWSGWWSEMNAGGWSMVRSTTVHVIKYWALQCSEAPAEVPWWEGGGAKLTHEWLHLHQDWPERKAPAEVPGIRLLCGAGDLWYCQHSLNNLSVTLHCHQKFTSCVPCNKENVSHMFWPAEYKHDVPESIGCTYENASLRYVNSVSLIVATESSFLDVYCKFWMYIVYFGCILYIMWSHMFRWSDE